MVPACVFTSGTPQMHACWLLLALNGEVPARILHIRPHQFVTKDRALISEVDLTSPDFPVVKPNIFTDIHYKIHHPDVNTALEEIGIKILIGWKNSEKTSRIMGLTELFMREGVVTEVDLKTWLGHPVIPSCIQKQTEESTRSRRRHANEGNLI
ncbi:MAG: hypothetical protein NT178_16070 [Proteobacteria bacterium]|nr:hypothetical protein [Pseudomonadota bacterium]